MKLVHSQVTDEKFDGPDPLFENKNDSEWLTTNEAAKYLRTSSGQIHNLTSSGRVRYFKLGRANRFLKSDLRQLLFSEERGVMNGN